MSERRKAQAIKSTESLALPPSNTLYYRGSRRLRDLPDGRQVWEFYHPIRGQWTRLYEVPLSATEARIIERRLRLAGDKV